jgi:hypothetical protein
MSSLDVADLKDYRYALKAMPDARLVMELLSIHYVYMGATFYPEHLDRYNAAKAEVLSRMDYEAGRPK